MLRSGRCVCASKVGVGVKSCLREASCVSAVCFSFSKLYVGNDEADPGQSSSPDLPSLHFAVPSQVSRGLGTCHNLCSWRFPRLRGHSLTLAQPVATSFAHVLFLSSACLYRDGCALQSLCPSDALLSQLARGIRYILQFPHKLTAQL